jgi:hypothetical protein
MQEAQKEDKMYNDYDYYESPAQKLDRETRHIDALLADNPARVPDRPALAKLGVTACRKALQAAECTIHTAYLRIWQLQDALRTQRAEVVRLTGLVDALKLRDSLRSGINKDTIIRWYAAWEKMKGYGARDTETKQLLLACKRSIVEHLVRRANKNGWVCGVAVDPTVVRYDLRLVLYIDTPHGQVSFHVRADEHLDMPEYLTPWTGRHDSEQVILAMLAEEDAAYEAREAAFDYAERCDVVIPEPEAAAA